MPLDTPEAKAAARRLRRASFRLTLLLLLIWALLAFVGPWFAADLDRWGGASFPLAYWVAAQGALLVFVLIVAVYARQMDRIEARYLAERRSPAAADAVGQVEPGA